MKKTIFCGAAELLCGPQPNERQLAMRYGYDVFQLDSDSATVNVVELERTFMGAPLTLPETTQKAVEADLLERLAQHQAVPMPRPVGPLRASVDVPEWLALECLRLNWNLALIALEAQQRVAMQRAVAERQLRNNV